MVNDRDAILLARSSEWSDKLTVPSGHTEPGQHAEDTIKREVKEEIGLDVESIELLLVQQSIYRKDNHKHQHFAQVLREVKGRDVRQWLTVFWTSS